MIMNNELKRTWKEEGSSLGLF